VPDVTASSGAAGTGASRDGGAGVVVRHATGSDVKAVAAIERSAFADPWPEEAFEAQLERRVAWFAVAEVDREVAGYLVAFMVADEAEIANIAVREDLRGRGIGAALLDASLNEARVRGVSSVFLEVRESNATARRLYASRGFRKAGLRRSYYRNPIEDAIVLRWSREQLLSQQNERDRVAE
jgi:ribosomal-protein-alanine N-acetyltransferase